MKWLNRIKSLFRQNIILLKLVRGGIYIIKFKIANINPKDVKALCEYCDGLDIKIIPIAIRESSDVQFTEKT